MTFPLKDKKETHEKIVSQTYIRLEKLSKLEEHLHKEKRKKEQWEIRRVANKANILHNELTDYIPFATFIFNKNLVYIPKEARKIIKWAKEYEDKYRKYIGLEPTK